MFFLPFSLFSLIITHKIKESQAVIAITIKFDIVKSAEIWYNIKMCDKSACLRQFAHI